MRIGWTMLFYTEGFRKNKQFAKEDDNDDGDGDGGGGNGVGGHKVQKVQNVWRKLLALFMKKKKNLIALSWFYFS